MNYFVFSARKRGTFCKRPENKGLQIHLDELSDRAYLAAHAQIHRNNKSAWKGYDASLFATHRDEQGDLISCEFKHALEAQTQNPRW